MLDELRKLLASHLHHVNAQPNQGTARLIEDHLKQLDGATGDEAAHKVLGELYAALNAPAPEVPAAPAKPAKKTAAALETPDTKA